MQYSVSSFITNVDLIVSELVKVNSLLKLHQALSLVLIQSYLSPCLRKIIESRRKQLHSGAKFFGASVAGPSGVT